MRTTRREFVKQSVFITALGMGLPGTVFPSRKAPEIVGHGDFKYKVEKDWGTQDPSRIPVKDCHEMIQDKQGRLLLLTNHTNNNMIIYDRSGKVLDTWTNNMPGAHGLTYWEGDEEFLFLTDTDLHKVYKTTLDGKVLMTLDYPRESGVYERAEAYKPTETAIGPDGDIYVADGYGQNYITRYSADGEYKGHFGGTGKTNETFDCCHGILVDYREDEPTLLITSRSTQEVKRFTLDGEYLSTISLPGCWICRPVIKGDYLYFAVIVTKSWGSYDGMVAVLDKNDRVVSLPGGNTPHYKHDQLQTSESDYTTFLNPHDVCVDQDENVYVPQWNSGMTYPIRLTRV